MTATITRESPVRSPVGSTTHRMLLVVGILTLIVGIGSLAGGIFGAWYTWDQAVAENVVTSEDAVIPEAPVRGPFTMWAQSDAIAHHQLESTGGLRYAEMPRQVPQVDGTGNTVIGQDGQPVMVANDARTSWVTATTLTTALNLGIVAYALAAIAIVVGIALVASGVAFLSIRKKALLA